MLKTRQQRILLENSGESAEKKELGPPCHSQCGAFFLSKNFRRRVLIGKMAIILQLT